MKFTFQLNPGLPEKSTTTLDKASSKGAYAEPNLKIPFLGFDPLHSGHLAYINKASLLGDHLVVALNSDNWLTEKKGQAFMPFNERKEILENLKAVNEVIGFDDSDGSCCDALEQIKLSYPENQIVFCNGGDRINQYTGNDCAKY